MLLLEGSMVITRLIMASARPLLGGSIRKVQEGSLAAARVPRISAYPFGSLQLSVSLSSIRSRSPRPKYHRITSVELRTRAGAKDKRLTPFSAAYSSPWAYPRHAPGHRGLKYHRITSVELRTRERVLVTWVLSTTVFAGPKPTQVTEPAMQSTRDRRWRIGFLQIVWRPPWFPPVPPTWVTLLRASARRRRTFAAADTLQLSKNTCRHQSLRPWRLREKLIPPFESGLPLASSWPYIGRTEKRCIPTTNLNPLEEHIEHPKTDKNPVSPPSKSEDFVRVFDMSEMNLQKNASK